MKYISLITLLSCSIAGNPRMPEWSPVLSSNTSHSRSQESGKKDKAVILREFIALQNHIPAFICNDESF